MKLLVLQNVCRVEKLPTHFELTTKKKKKNGKEYLEGANNHKQKENRLIKPRIELYANNDIYQKLKEMFMTKYRLFSIIKEI
jgi:hypothetical protein